jgi:hypothetical protein
MYWYILKDLKHNVFHWEGEPNHCSIQFHCEHQIAQGYTQSKIKFSYFDLALHVIIVIPTHSGI